MTRVLLVAPPFSGHLNPLIAIAHDLRARGMSPHFATGPTRLPLLERLGFAADPILGHDPGAFDRIANSSERVASNPIKLARQLRANLELLVPATAQLTEIAERTRPDVILADFTAPPSGLVATRLGIPWITTMPTPFVLETRTGTPSYCGGWGPTRHVGHRVRNAAGRASTRALKLSLQAIFARRFRELGTTVYRADGSEAAYSPELILGLGVQELEFERDWPDHFALIGPITASPEPAGPLPEVFGGDRPRVLVSLGTHLLWAKSELPQRVCRLAARLPDVSFVISGGDPSGPREVTRLAPHVLACAYLPYDAVMPRFDAVIHHGGAGVTYSALRAGKPSVVWPRDYDQFDFAARIVHAGVGVRIRNLGDRGSARAMQEALAWDRAPQVRLQQAIAETDPLGAVAAAVTSAANRP